MNTTSPPADWLDKARQDARAARRLLVEPPEAESAAYHVHQAVEKAIEALLSASGIAFPRRGGAGHDLVRLARLVPETDPLHAQTHRLSDLTPWATVFRYPADDPLTMQPTPTLDELRERLDETEALVDEVAARLAPSET